MTAAKGARDFDATFDDGSWSFAESTKSCTTAIDNKSIDYKLIAPEAAKFRMLISSTLESCATVGFRHGLIKARTMTSSATISTTAEPSRPQAPKRSTRGRISSFF